MNFNSKKVCNLLKIYLTLAALYFLPVLFNGSIGEVEPFVFKAFLGPLAIFAGYELKVDLNAITFISTVTAISIALQVAYLLLENKWSIVLAILGGIVWMAFGFFFTFSGV